MSCERKYTDAQIGQFTAGTMRARPRRNFEAHLDSCPDCEERVAMERARLQDIRDAASRAGWRPEMIDQLTGKRAGTLTAGMNWRLIFTLVAAMLLFGLAPLVWWADRPQTRMGLLADIERETRLEAGLDARRSRWEPILERHQNGDDDLVIARLVALQTDSLSREEAVYAQRLLGLSYLMQDEVDLALPHLLKASAAADDSSAQRATWYLANAYLKAGDGNRARAALEQAAALPGSYTASANRMLQALDAL